MLGTDDEVRVEGANGAVIGTVAAQLVVEAFDQVKRRGGIDRLLSGAQPGERAGAPLRRVLSQSFAFGGSNAALVLEAAP